VRHLDPIAFAVRFPPAKTCADRTFLGAARDEDGVDHEPL